MSMFLGLFIVFGFFAVGDYLGIKTKAKLSSVFVALLLFLVCFVGGILPPDIIETAGLTKLSKMATMFLVFNMGTSVNLSQMRKEWKVVVFSIAAMAVAVGAVALTIPLIGKQAAIVSIPIVNGGIVATQIMTEAALEKGFTLAAALGTLVFAVQKFVGTIPASRCGLSEAKKLVEEYRESLKKGIDLNEAKVAEEVGSQPAKPVFYKTHDKYYTVYITLGIAAGACWVASLIQDVTGISGSIWCLLLGMLLNQIGLVPPKMLDKGKSAGLFMIATFSNLIPSLAKINMSDLVSLAFQIIVVFAAVLIGCFVVLYFLPTWKFVGSKNMAMGIAMSQLLGFPATFLIVNEVATAVAETEEEKDYVINKLTPAFVISGFVSVTTISILVAGIFAKFL